ncbi:uncharacterized protein TNCV_1270811 [Trichonephila clavipes]|nr:uncharacterized protein TNCV_1270811 [Trichonephila clavipes]
MDWECPNELFKFLHYLNVGTICVTDQYSKQTFKEIQASWSSSSQFKRTPVMLLNSNGHGYTHILFKSRKEDSSRRFTSVDASHQCTMDQIYAFPEHISTTVVPVTLPENPEVLEYAARPGQVRACIIYQEPNTKRVFVLFCKDNWCRANPNLFRRSFEPYDQMLYHRMMLEPHTTYPIPPGTRYILLTIQKTVKLKRYDQKAYKLPPPTPAHVPAETNKRPLEEQPGSSSKRNRVFITPFIRPPVAPVLITRPSMALSTPQPGIIPEPPVLTTPQTLLPDPPRPPELTTPLVQIPVFQPPVQIPDPPVQIPVFQPPVQTPTVQLFLPDPPHVQILLLNPPVFETLEPNLTDDSSIDQIMSSVFGDCSQQGLPRLIPKNPSCLTRCLPLFDESNDLISFLDHFETGLAIEQQETPMELTIPHSEKESQKDYWV